MYTDKKAGTQHYVGGEMGMGGGAPPLVLSANIFFNLQTENCKIFDPPFWEQVKTDLR